MGRAHRRGPVLPLLLCMTALALALSSCGGKVPGGNGSTGGSGEKTDGTGAGLRNDYSFLVCGDPHGRTDLLGEVIGQAREGEFLVIVGDITTGRSLDEMRGMKGFLDGTGIEYHVIPGDNDMPAGDRSVFETVFGPDHYAVDFQGSRLVFLNDAVRGVGCPEEQLTWLRGEVAGAGEDKLVIAFTHVPPGAPVALGRDGFQEQETASAREMLEILEQAGAPALYCGHIHAYMLYSSGPPRVLVTGGAGADLHVSEPSGGYHHFLRVTVKGSEVSEEVVRL